MRLELALAILVSASSLWSQVPHKVPKPLGRVELLALRIDRVPDDRLAKMIGERGIDFLPGDDYLEALAQAGAQEPVIAALKAAKSSAPRENTEPSVTAKETAVLQHLFRAVQLNRNDIHPEDAEPELRAGVEADPQNVFAHLALGGILLRLSRWDPAAAEFREAIRIDPDIAQAHLGLGQTLLGLKQFDAAVGELRSAVYMEPDNGRAHRELGIALERESAARNPSPVKRIRLGGQVAQAKLTHQVRPKYPREAKKNHIEGKVRLEALIGRDGHIKDLKIVSGDPILAKAATEAVSQWKYQPTLLSGEAVEVLTEIDVNFYLR